MPSVKAKIKKKPNRRALALMTGGVLVLVAAAHVNVAMAQEVVRDQSVFQRPRPDYDPLGMRAGSFLIFPKVELGEAYNDNIFAVEHHKDDDFITLVSPQVRAQSDWGRHAVGLTAGADAGIYASHSDENFVDGRVLGDGRLDIVQQTYLLGGAGWQHLHEERGNPNSPNNGKTPTQFELYTANLAFVRARGRLSARADTDFARLEFHNVDATGGGHVDEQQRDRNAYQVAGTLGYEYLPNTSAFVRMIGRWVEYDELDNGVDRSSEGYAVQLGTALDFTSKTSGEVHVGFQHTHFDDQSLENVNAPSIGGSMLWNATGLTSVRGLVSVTTQETTQQNASAYVAYRGGVEVEHELLRNVLLGAGFTLGEDHYEGISRNDRLYLANLSARYLINRNFYAGATYFYRQRSSDGSNDQFTQNIFLVRLGAQL